MVDLPDAAATPSQLLSWARLAAVRRTLEWVRSDAERLPRAPYIGANCARLLRQAGQLDPARQPPVELVQVLDALDALAEPDARLQAVDRACRLLDEVLPLTEAGATVLPVDAQATLVLPEQQRDLRRAPRPAGDAAPAARGPAPAATGGPAPASTGTPPPAEAPPAAAPEPTLEELLEALSRPAPAASPRAAPVEEEPPPRLPFHHEERGRLPLSALPGAAPEVIERLAEQGIETVADLLRRPPGAVDRKPMLRSAVDLPEGEVLVRGVVRTRCSRLAPGLTRREVVIDSRDGFHVVARWMGARPRGFESWAPGAEVALVGAVLADEAEGAWPTPRLVIYEAEPVGLDGRGSGWMSCYDLDGVDDRTARELVAHCIELVLGTVKDTLPPQIVERHRLLPIDEALRDSHFPANNAGRGRTRLAFEELLLLQLGVALQQGRGKQPRGVPHRALHGYLGQLELQHGIRLDDGQERAFSDIRRDLARQAPMTRLLQGDVGAGKGLIALLTAVVVAENRTQVAMVCPDAHSAERRFVFAEGLLRSLGISTLLVTGQPGHAQLDAIRRGEALIVFGTTSLLGPKLDWRKLGLVVVEERDRYGTVRPGDLPNRSQRPDLLVLTAAPIPTSLAFSVFGEFDLSLVPRTSPSRAVPRVLPATDRNQAYELVREQVAKGHQAYVVFPVSDGRDLLGPDDARRFADALQAEVLPDARFAIYSTAMSREERFRVFDDFRHHRLDVLVSTTFIEDAPAVENATIVVVEHADKHDLIRLYRLRGLLQHGTCCFVQGDPPSEQGARLVQLASEEADGYRLAEIDLQVRGVEVLLGERATEAPELDWADPPEDRALLLRARSEAFELVKADPELRRSRSLARAVSDRWGDWLGDGGPAADEAPDPSRGGRARGRRRRRRKR